MWATCMYVQEAAQLEAQVKTNLKTSRRWGKSNGAGARAMKTDLRAIRRSREAGKMNNCIRTRLLLADSEQPRP